MRSHAKDASAPSTHRENTTFSLGVFAAMLACAAAFLGIGASAAGAATAGQSYGYQTTLGTGGFQLIDEMFRSVATDEAGRVYIARQRDDFFVPGGFEVVDPDGTSVVQQAGFITGIAVTPDGMAVYALPSGGTPIKFISDGAPMPTYSEDPGWTTDLHPSDILVDPNTGDVLVAKDGSILRLNPDSGDVLSSIDGFNASRIAVAPSGDIYALDQGAQRVVHLGSDGTPKGELDVPTTKTSWENPGIAVNPQSGDVALRFPPGFVTSNDTVVRIYTSADDFKEDVRLPSAAAAGSNSLAFSSDGTKLYVGTNLATGQLFELGTQPGLDGPTASQVTPFGFHLSDSVATGGQPTKAHFEYCLASEPCLEYLSSEAPSPWHTWTDHEGLESSPGSDPIADDITGLEPLQDYFVRSYAVNDKNIEKASAPVSVSTPLSPPDAQTGEATADLEEATVTGTINAFGGQTTYHFEYGATTGYGSRVPVKADAIAGGLRAPRVVSQVIKGLQSGTTYHYRLVATNAAGTTAGDDHTFTTLSADQAPPQRGYEQATSPDKQGLVLNSTYGFQVAPGGGAIEYAAAAPASNAESAAQSSRYIARRGEAGWAGQQSIDPPQTPTRAILNSVTLAVSDDFEHSLSVSPVALTPDAIEGAANLYVRDLSTGAYRLVGTATQPGAWSGLGGTKRGDTYIAGAPDFSWIVLNSRFPLLPAAPQVAQYKWSDGGGLTLLSRLPDGSIPTGNTWVQSFENVANRLASDDGDTTAFSLTSGEEGVYRRAGGQTEAISISQASGGPTGVQPGIAVDMSRDGRFVVFISHSQLTDDSTDLTGVPRMNAYRFDGSDGRLEFLGVTDGTGDGSIDIVAVSDDGNTVYFNGSEDNSYSTEGLMVWRGGQHDLVLSNVQVRDGRGFISPNGRFIVFRASNSVHFYDANTGDETCISCGVTGDAEGWQLPDPERNISNQRPQVVTDDGHAFFGSPQPLLSVDRNSSNDVYEYFNGRLTLISPGDGKFTAILVGVSPDARDVFFTTAQGLVGQDNDGQYDVYDARIGGGLAAQNPLVTPPCIGEGCLGVPAGSPVASTPGSAQVRGAGPPKQTHKKRCGKKAQKGRKGRARCAKKQGGRSSKKRNNDNNRRAGR